MSHPNGFQPLDPSFVAIMCPTELTNFYRTHLFPCSVKSLPLHLANPFGPAHSPLTWYFPYTHGKKSFFNQ
jgi:hypothetical protein